MGSNYSNIAIRSIASGNSPTTVPTVSTVALTGSVGAVSNTLSTGDIVYATVTFSQAVEVTGVVGSTPLLTLTIGATPVNAIYSSGSGTASLIFAYTILSGQNDANGISIGANSLLYNSGSIKSLSGVTATITHTAVADNPTYLVDATSPTISSIGITGITGISNGYGNVGDIINATVGFTKSIVVSGSPILVLNIGGTSVNATYSSGSGSSSLVFVYTILSGQNDPNGVSIDANSLNLNGGTLADSVGNTATITHLAVADNASYRVDTTAPTVSSIGITGITGISNGYGNAGDTVTATVGFTKTVTVTGLPIVVLNIGGTSVNATYSSGSSSSSLTFTYIILSGQNDSNGISITANSLSLNGGTINDLAGNAAILVHDAVADNASYRVDTTSPTVSNVVLSSTTGSSFARLYYAANSGATAYTFTDVNGASLGSNPTLNVFVGDVLTFSVFATGHPFWIKTAAVTGTGSGVTTGTISNNGTASGQVIWNTAGVSPGTYYYACQIHGPMQGQIIVASGGVLSAGDTVTGSVTFNEIVLVTGSPFLTLNINSTLVNAGYSSGSNSTTIAFVYTILSGQVDANGISINANSINLNSGTINDPAGNTATLTHAAVVDNSSYIVDAVAPTITSIVFNAFKIGASATGVLNAGDTVFVDVTFSKNIRVSYGVTPPSLNLNIGGTTVSAAAGSITNNINLQFSATIPSGVNDANGISINANSLALGTGSITDLAGNPATLTHAAVVDNPSYVVDTTAPAAPTLTAGTYASSSSVNAQMAENGTIYIVNTSVTVANLASITGASGDLWNSQAVSANTLTAISLSGLVGGTYRAYAVDAADNISTASTNSITVTSAVPSAQSFTPSSGATNVTINTSVVIVFDLAIQRGTGIIELRSGSSTGTIIENFAASSSNRITISSATFTLQPTSNLSTSTVYFVIFPAGSIQSTSSTNWGGTSTYNFTTSSSGSTAPQGRWIAGGTGNLVRSSNNNGTTWTTLGVTSGPSGAISHAVLAGRVLIVVGNGSGNTTTTAYGYSENFGSTWFDLNSLSPAQFTSVAYGNGTMAFASTTGVYNTTESLGGSSGDSNLTGWSNIGFSEATQQFILLNSGTSQIYTFTGGNFATRVSRYSGTVSGNAMGGPAIKGSIVIFPRNGGLLRSTDGGNTWTNLSVSVTTTGADFRGVAWVTGTFWIAVAYSSVPGTNYLFSNDDGATWTTQTGGPNISWWSCFGSNGQNGAMVKDIGLQTGASYWTGDGINWTTGTSPGSYGSYLLGWIENWAPTATNPMIVTSRTTSTNTGQAISSGALASPDVYAIIKSGGTPTGSQYDGARITFRLAGGTVQLHGLQPEIALGPYFNFTASGVTCASDFDGNVYTYNDTFFKNGIGGFWSGAYSGNGTNGRAISHGLGIAPDVIIVIPRNVANTKGYWQRGVCYDSNFERTNFPITGRGTHLSFGNNASIISTNGFFGDSGPSSSTQVSQTNSFVVSSSLNANGTNYQWMAFCRIPGVCNVGTYVGRAGSASREVFHGLGTGVRFLMIKSVSTTNSWWTWDTTRGLTNVGGGVTENNQAWDLGSATTAADSIINQNNNFTIVQNATTSIAAAGTTYLWVAWAA
jgi:plastocyanin